jgi:hypothetical protein
MRNKKFIKLLEDKGIEYKIDNNEIIITSGGVNSQALKYLSKKTLKYLSNENRLNKYKDIHLSSLKSIPKRVKFNNHGNVDLRSIGHLPKGVEFNNGGYVDLSLIVSISKGVRFNNNGNIYLPSLEYHLSKGIRFSNGKYVDLNSLKSLPEGTKFDNGGGVGLSSLKSLPKGTQFNNGGEVYLCSLESLTRDVKFNNGWNISLRSLGLLPEGAKFNNGGHVDLRCGTVERSGSYLDRHKVKITDNHVTLYKKVSIDFKTQEGTENETLWEVGTTLTHDNWEPYKSECGKGKFHACARAHWCDGFRNRNDDKYIAIKVAVSDLYEWPDEQEYPQKIAFRKGKVLYECDRDGNRLS